MVPSERFAFRPGLDGLRALAVLAVLAYHGGGGLPGGYLGVDVFLVLSGYLVTALLLAERDGAGRVSLRAFWGRRLRRLAPVLVLVAFAVTAAAVVGPGAEDMGALRGDVLATLGGVVNWRFALGDQSYFAGFTGVSPLRHMWSLALELQWYVLWPPLLLVMLRALRRWWAACALTLGLAALSAWAAAAWFDPGRDPSRLYYGTDTRVQALLVGGALALVLHRRTLAGRRLVAAETAGVVGLAVLAWAVLDLSALDRRLYQGGFGLVAVAAASVVLAASQPGSLVVGRALSVAPLRHLGRMSYGVYGWHWPVYLALDTASTGLEGAALLGVRVAATLVVATASFVLVEEPIRRGVAWPGWSGAASGLTAAAAVGVAVLLVLAPQAAPEAVSAAPRERPRTAPTAVVDDDGLTVPLTPPPPVRGTTSVMVAGDSVALTLATGFTPAAAGRGVRWAGEATYLGCGVVSGRPFNDGHPVLWQDPACAHWQERWAGAVSELRPDVAVVLLGAWETLDHEVDGAVLRVGSRPYRRYLLDRLEQGVAILARGGARIVLLTAPCYRAAEQDPSLGTSDRNDGRRVAWFNGIVAEVGRRHPQWVSVLDLQSVACPDGRPEPGLRTDGVHFSEAGAAHVWRWLGPQLRALGAA